MCEIFDITFDDIHVIKGLWERNRLFHEGSSQYFKELYRSIIFEERIEGLLGLESEDVKISVAEIDSEYIGYCISTIIGGRGEVESLHVHESYRERGIGQKLVNRHIEWMKEKNCNMIGVTVSQENESTICFYRKLGFYPNTLYMQLK